MILRENKGKKEVYSKTEWKKWQELQRSNKYIWKYRKDRGSDKKYYMLQGIRKESSGCKMKGRKGEIEL